MMINVDKNWTIVMKISHALFADMRFYARMNFVDNVLKDAFVNEF